MARRLIILGLIASLVAPAIAQADGLYKGIGRRTIDYSWTWRVNGSIGFQAVEDPWDQFGVNSFPIGGVTALGIERATLPGQSIEVHGTFQWVHDDADLVGFQPPTGPPVPGSFRYDVDAWSAGATWRFYVQQGTNSAFIGLGGAWVFASDLEYREQFQGSTPYRIAASGNGPEVHAVMGVDGVPNPHFRFGIELGFRYSWVDFDQGIYGAGNFNGFWLAARGSLVRR